ncbi:MAG TPA: Uma2 family endonuclease, partial [Allocoleopsis sp.]
MSQATVIKEEIKSSPDILSETTKKMTFEEYLLYVPDDDFLYELDKGELIQMSAPSGLHTGICHYLLHEIQDYLSEQNLPLVVRTSVGVRTNIASSRIPDVIVCTESLWQELINRQGAGVFNTGEIPALVIEVVSEDRRVDYVTKRGEYEVINIPEYWIIDSKKQLVRLLTNGDNEEGYIQEDFLKGDVINSQVFPGLIIPVDLILSPPIVENLRKEEKRQFLLLSQNL